MTTAAAAELSEPFLTLKSTYAGKLEAHAESAGPEATNVKVEETFKVEVEQRVDNQGHTIVLRKVEVSGSEAGEVPNGAGGSEKVSCTLSQGPVKGPGDFRPAGTAPTEPGEGAVFISSPAYEYGEFDARSFLPTDSLGETSPEEVTGTPLEGAKACQYARKAGGFVKEFPACTPGVQTGTLEGEPFLPELDNIKLSDPPPPETALKLEGKCESGAIAGAKEEVAVHGTLALEVENAPAVLKAHAEEVKRAEEEAEKRKQEEEEEKRKAEEEAHKVEVPKPPAPPPPPPPPPPPAEPPLEAVVAAETRPPKKLTPAQVRRLARKSTSPSDRGRNRALTRALTAALRLKAAKCTVALAIDGAVDAVRFISPIPGERTGGGAVTDISTRRCLNLLAQTRAALVVARHDPPSARYPTIRLPARAAGASPPCTPAALPAAQYAACNALDTADRESDRHLERVALVATAVAGTINRHSGAMLAGRQADAEFQDIAYNALIAELGQSLERANEADIGFARALAAAGTNITFGRALAAHTPRHLQRLVRRAKGASRSALRTLLGAAQLAVPSLPADYRTALSRLLPVGALADGGSFKPRQLILLVRQLVKQSQIPSGLGATMVGELGAMKRAKGAAATTLRRQLAAAIRQLTTEAGPLLEAATRIRSPRL